jgi:HlyD family secretion protein
VLTVPNAALRFQPPSERVEGGASPAGPAEGRDGRRGEDGGGGGSGGRGALWLPAGANVRRLPVKVGLSDRLVTEVEGEGLAEGTAVVVGDDRAGAAPAAAASPQNPFTPQMRRGR